VQELASAQPISQDPLQYYGHIHLGLPSAYLPRGFHIIPVTCPAHHNIPFSDEGNLNFTLPVMRASQIHGKMEAFHLSGHKS
jgi:hypothetical protein